jgi:hypothetical protein
MEKIKVFYRVKEKRNGRRRKKKEAATGRP